VICTCRGCFRRIPENTTLCIPCQPIQSEGEEQVAPYHGPGGTHGYLGAADEAQLDAIHNLLEWIESHPEHTAFVQEIEAFYAAFRGE
jgi:hypothetical protein